VFRGQFDARRAPENQTDLVLCEWTPTPALLKRPCRPSTVICGAPTSNTGIWQRYYDTTVGVEDSGYIPVGRPPKWPLLEREAFAAVEGAVAVSKTEAQKSAP